MFSSTTIYLVRRYRAARAKGRAGIGRQSTGAHYNFVGLLASASDWRGRMRRTFLRCSLQQQQPSLGSRRFDDHGDPFLLCQVCTIALFRGYDFCCHPRPPPDTSALSQPHSFLALSATVFYLNHSLPCQGAGQRGGVGLGARDEGDWVPNIRGPPMTAAEPSPKEKPRRGERGFLARRPKGGGPGTAVYSPPECSFSRKRAGLGSSLVRGMDLPRSVPASRSRRSATRRPRYRTPPGDHEIASSGQPPPIRRSRAARL